MYLLVSPKPASRVNYRSIDITPTTIYRIELYSGQAGPPNFGIFPTLGQQVQGVDSDTVATVIDSGTTHIDVINITGGTFNLNEENHSWHTLLSTCPERHSTE